VNHVRGCEVAADLRRRFALGVVMGGGGFGHDSPIRRCGRLACQTWPTNQRPALVREAGRRGQDMRARCAQ
jgi:hypothetical protein